MELPQNLRLPRTHPKHATFFGTKAVWGKGAANASGKDFFKNARRYLSHGASKGLRERMGINQARAQIEGPLAAVEVGKPEGMHSSETKGSRF